VARTIGSITLDDGANAWLSEVNIPSVRDVQLAQMINRQGRITRIKEDRHPLVIDVRGTWADGGGKYWRDFKAALLNQSRAAFTLGDGTRYEMVDVTEIADTKLAQVGALTATPGCLYAYTMKVASYEPYSRDVGPSLVALGSMTFTPANLLSATQASFETSLSGWAAANANTALGIAGVNAMSADAATFETTLGGWTANTSCVVSRVNTQALHGSWSMAISAVSTGDVIAVSPYAFSGYPVIAGRTYSALAYVRADTTSRTVQIGIGFFDATGNVLASSLIGSPTASLTTGWARLSVSGAAPAGAAYAFVSITVRGTLAVDVQYIDCVGFFAGTVTTWTLPGWAAINGVQSMSMVAVAAGTTAAITNVGTGGFPVTAGTTYTAMGWSRAAASARSVGVNINWYDSGGAFLSTSTGSTVANSTSTWTQVTVTVAAPASSAFASISAVVSGPTVANETHYWEQMGFAAGTSTVWQAGGNSGIVTTTYTVSYPGTAYAEPTWQLTVVVPSGVAVQQVALQNTTTGELCTVAGLNLYAGTWYVLFDASGGVVPATGAVPSPNNNGYSLLAVPSLGYGVTVSLVGGSSTDADFVGKLPLLVPPTTPNIPPTPQVNTIIATVNATGTLTSASLSILAPSRWVR
jgi:hypothetical protein